MNFLLNGIIASNEDAKIYRHFGFDAVCPADCRRALRDKPPDEPVTVLVNSPGGDVYAGFELYSILRGVSAPVRAEAQSLAASAASVVLMGADIAAASPVAQIMIHLPSMTTRGDQFQHRHGAEILESVTESILAAYLKKCKNKTARDVLRGMMDKETFLTARQALELGLIDEITDDAPATIMNAAGGAPDIVRLRDAYQRCHPEPEKANQTRLRRIALAEATFQDTENFLKEAF